VKAHALWVTLLGLSSLTGYGAEPDPATKAFDEGSACLVSGDFDSAIAAFTEAIRLDPEDAEAYYGRGVAYEKKGEKSKAEEDFAQAKKLGYEP